MGTMHALRISIDAFISSADGRASGEGEHCEMSRNWVHPGLPMAPLLKKDIYPEKGGPRWPSLATQPLGETHTYLSSLKTSLSLEHAWGHACLIDCASCRPRPRSTMYGAQAPTDMGRGHILKKSGGKVCFSHVTGALVRHSTAQTLLPYTAHAKINDTHMLSYLQRSLGQMWRNWNPYL